MTTFIIGLVMLLVGGTFYGRYCEKVFHPDDRQTPAFRLKDGVDYVPMKGRKNALIELLNIAGTGPILGPIQGILFGPIAFIFIPIGCVLGGALHDYMSGMISLRSDGEQMPSLIKRHLGTKVHKVYNIFVIILMILVGAVFIYTPGDLIVANVLKQEAIASNPTVWVVYAIIFAYYICATLFPIDKIIGRVYPIFGAILLISAVGIFFGLFAKGYQLDNLSASTFSFVRADGVHLFPVFFVTVACGIVSGFHSTQATLIARSVKSEKEGRYIFYDMMILEGFIAMIWAAAAMGMYNKGIDAGLIGKPGVIGLVANDMLGSVGGLIAIIGIIVLPITSGDTALRSARLMIADHLHISQTKMKNRLSLAIGIFIAVLVILIFAKLSPNGFNVLWQYFAWANQTIAVFAFGMIAVYLKRNGKNPWISIIPGMFYMYIIITYIMNAKIGFNLPYSLSNIIGFAAAILYAYFISKLGKKSEADASRVLN